MAVSHDKSAYLTCSQVTYAAGGIRGPNMEHSTGRWAGRTNIPMHAVCCTGYGNQTRNHNPFSIELTWIGHVFA